MKKLLFFALIFIKINLFSQTTCWNFTHGLEGWTLANQVTGSVNYGVLNLQFTGGDPYINSPNNLGIPANVYKYVIIRAKNQANSSGATLFWTNQTGLHATSFSEVSNDSILRTYIVDLSKNPEWTGSIQSLRFDPAGSNLGSIIIDYIQVVGTYNTTNLEVPVAIEAENFNIGGQKSSYFDSTTSNSGNLYRVKESPDIFACGDAGRGYCVGMLQTGEWMEYLIKIPKDSSYFFDVRAAATDNANTFHLELNGIRIGTQYSMDNTGGLDNWITLRQKIRLKTGFYVMRLVIDNSQNSLCINNITASCYVPPVSFLKPGKVGSYLPGDTASIVVSVRPDMALQVSKIEIFQNGIKTDETNSSHFAKSITSISKGYYNMMAYAKNVKGEIIDSAQTELFCGSSKVGVRPLPSLAVWGDTPGGSYEANEGLYPFVAQNIHSITVVDQFSDKVFVGDFKTKNAFFEYYIGMDQDWINTDPYTSGLIHKIRLIEAEYREVEHVIISREAFMVGHGKDGPYPEDTRILYDRDVTEIRKLFQDAFDAGLVKHNNYKLIQMVKDGSFFYTNANARKTIVSMDGVTLELHQYGAPSGGSLDDYPDFVNRTAKAIRWTLANNLDYILYYGPTKSIQCADWYDDMVKEWMYKLWDAGMPKHHDRMHYYMNFFPFGCSENMKVGPENDPHSRLGYLKWFIEQVSVVKR